VLGQGKAVGASALNMEIRRQDACTGCGRATKRFHPILRLPLCLGCQQKDRHKYGYITKTRALEEYRLKPKDISHLTYHEVDNPHYKKAAPMVLYLHSQIRDRAAEKWGSPEPYRVQLVEFPPEILTWFLEDLERLKQLDPSSFERLVANRLERMGLNVHLVGNVFRMDGGIDIIAYPKPERCAVPFLLAVRAKHHRTDRKTGAPDVQRFLGAMRTSRPQFHFGMIVTNTAFTANAAWCVSSDAAMMRLRDLRHLRRWLQNDVANEAEWSEMPPKIELAPGVSVPIPRPKSFA